MVIKDFLTVKISQFTVVCCCHDNRNFVPWTVCRHRPGFGQLSKKFMVAQSYIVIWQILGLTALQIFGWLSQLSGLVD